MARRTNSGPSHARTRGREILSLQGANRGGRHPVEIAEARQHLAKKIKDDVGWWYNQARRIVESPQGRTDDNAAKVVLAVLDKLLPSLKEVVQNSEANAQPPVAITIHGINRGLPRHSAAPGGKESIEIEVDGGGTD